MAALFNKCEFISAEINHDFHKPRHRLNEYQVGWEQNTICNHNLVAQTERRAGADGDDDLVKQIFWSKDAAGSVSPVSKPMLKNLTPGVEYMISAFVSPTINLSEPLPQPGVSIAQALTPAGMMQVPMYVAHADVNAKDPRGIYGVFKYPDENFLIIDAVPNFVTSILKYLRFPTTVDSSRMAPDQYTNLTTEQLFDAHPNGPWPFRPKINVINTPSTLGDPQPTCDPGAPKFSINARLPPEVLYSNTSNIPGGLDNVNNSCPLIYTWYYTQPEQSSPNNPLMMSRYRIKMGPLGTGYGYKQAQHWTDADPGVFIGPPNGAAKENSIDNLKKTMIERGITQNTPRPGTTRERYNVTAGSEAEASLLVQRKRSGDYLQMKTAYEFPALAERHGNNRAIYEMILGPQGAMNLGADGSKLSGEGNFKERPSTMRNKEWYRNRTYFCTGDWPAFCYATYNKINCILICKRRSCAAASNSNIIFRNYFGT